MRNSRIIMKDCGGLRLVERLKSDDSIIAEIERRGYWDALEPELRSGSRVYLVNQSRYGVDAFLWDGMTDDPYFTQWTLMGGKINTPPCEAMMNEIRDWMPLAFDEAFVGKDDTPWQS